MLEVVKARRCPIVRQKSGAFDVVYARLSQKETPHPSSPCFRIHQSELASTRKSQVRTSVVEKPGLVDREPIRPSLRPTDSVFELFQISSRPRIYLTAFRHPHLLALCKKIIFASSNNLYSNAKFLSKISFTLGFNPSNSSLLNPPLSLVLTSSFSRI